MLELVRRHPRFGYRRIWALLRRAGWKVNRKRIWRLWRQQGAESAEETAEKATAGFECEQLCTAASGVWQSRVDLGLHLRQDQ